MANIIDKIFQFDKIRLNKYRKESLKVLAYEDEMAKLSDEELRAKTPYFRNRLANGETLEEVTVGGKDYYTFVMPNSAANLKLAFRADTGEHSIEIDRSSFGDHSVSISLFDSTFTQVPLSDYFGTAGEKFYLDIYVQDGALFKAYANGEEMATEDVQDYGMTFTYYVLIMPDEDVTITLEF